MATRKKETTGTVGAYQKALNRGDGFINQNTGQGVAGIDKTVGGFYASRGRIDEELLTELHTGNDLSSLVVDIIPEESFRLGFKVKTGDATEDAALATKLDELDVVNNLMDGDRWARLYGGALVVIGTEGGGPPHTPLNTATVERVAWLKVVDLTEVTPHEWDAFGNPTSYLITPRHIAAPVSTTIVHASRVVRFDGVKTAERRKQEYNGWSDSVLNRVYDVIRSFDGVFNNIETLLADGNQAIFKMSGLAAAIAADTTGTQAIEARFRMMNNFRSVHRALVLDAGDGVDPAEEFERQDANFTGLADIMAKFILRLSSALRIPASILMGQSPAGLDATGEADFRGFYDRISAHQNHVLSLRVRRIVEIVRASREWERRSDDPVRIEWPALWTPSDKEVSETRLINANADAVYISNGVLTPEEVTLSRFTAHGYSNSITITEAGREAREQSLEETLGGINGETESEQLLSAGGEEQESNPITVQETGIRPDPAPGR